jgi:hypothetical protein
VALHEVAHGVLAFAAFMLIAVVMAALELDELLREAANALARPKDRG